MVPVQYRTAGPGPGLRSPRAGPRPTRPLGSPGQTRYPVAAHSVRGQLSLRRAPMVPTRYDDNLLIFFPCLSTAVIKMVVLPQVSASVSGPHGSWCLPAFTTVRDSGGGGNGEGSAFSASSAGPTCGSSNAGGADERAGGGWAA